MLERLHTLDAFRWFLVQYRSLTPHTLQDGVHVRRLHRHVLGMTTNTRLRGCGSPVGEVQRLGLWVWSGQKRNVISPVPDQRWPPVLFSVRQSLWKGFAFAFWEEQDGEDSQQGERRVNHMVQKVAVVVTQIHKRRAESTHATQSHYGSNTTSSVDTTRVSEF